MAFVSKIAIDGLFGLYDHEVKVRSRPRVTIIAGPNGIGKTTLLGLTQALLTGDHREVAKHDFGQLVVEFQDDTSVRARPLRADDESAVAEQLELELRLSDGSREEVVIDVPSSVADLTLPPYVEQRAPDVFFDQRMRETLSLDEALARYGRRPGSAKHPSGPNVVWHEEHQWAVDFIETKRLDTLMATERQSRNPRRREPEPAPIHTYLRAVNRSVEMARSKSTRIRQRRDRNFVKRLLETKASRASVNEPRLRERYRSIEQEAELLANNGLLTDSLDILPEAKLNPTEKRIIKLFLDDFEATLRALRPVATKVDNLRAIIDSKFLNKKLEIETPEGVSFRSDAGQVIAPESLSSGEQHQLALISKLLFTESRGTTVLIDEPELSLHVGWQHEMVEDLAQIARLADISFVLATHSTAIINGRWDLVDELGPIGGNHDD